jgi:hypothetical protein
VINNLKSLGTKYIVALTLIGNSSAATLYFDPKMIGNYDPDNPANSSKNYYSGKILPLKDSDLTTNQ